MLGINIDEQFAVVYAPKDPQPQVVADIWLGAIKSPWDVLFGAATPVEITYGTHAAKRTPTTHRCVEFTAAVAPHTLALLDVAVTLDSLALAIVQVSSGACRATQLRGPELLGYKVRYTSDSDKALVLVSYSDAVVLGQEEPA